MADEDARARWARLVELFDAAGPETEDEARAELRAAGLDPVLVRARMQAFAAEQSGRTARAGSERCAAEVTAGGAATEARPLPWVRREEDRWVCDRAVAAQQRDERSWLSLDFSDHGLGGGMRVGLFVAAGPDGQHALTVEWDAAFFHPPGFLLSLWRCGEQRPFFQRNIGSGYSGSVILTAASLGLDPARTPLKFAIDPDDHPGEAQH
jgi:hypothetical protein